jgi:uncharacterized protein (TIGR02265 family)
MPIDERRFFSVQALELLFRGPVRAKVPEKVRARLRQEGLDLDAPLPKLPAARWRRLVDVAAKELHPRMNRADGHRQVARMLVQSYRETLLGKALLAVARMMGARDLALQAHERLKERKSRNAKLTQLDGERFELWLARPAISAAFTEALIAEGLDALGAVDVRVRRVRSRGKGSIFDVQWEQER